MRWGKFLLGSIIIYGSVLQAQPPSHTAHFSPFIDNNINGFWEYLPRNYQTDIQTTYPLIIFLHGGGESGSGQDMTTISRVLNTGLPHIISTGNFPDSFDVGAHWYKFIVISPQIKYGIENHISIITPSTIKAVLQYVKSTYRVDTSRIYLCGLSMGGGAIWDYAGSSVQAGRQLAAVAIACGAGDLSATEADNFVRSGLPVLATHNEDDDVIFISRTRANISAIMARSPAILPTAVYWQPPPSYKHNAWKRTFEDIFSGSTPGGNLTDTIGLNVYEWLLQFTRKVNDIHIENRLLVYPNPFRREVIVYFSCDHETDFYIRLFNTNGKLVAAKKYKANFINTSFLLDNLQRLSAGNYYLQVMSDDRKVVLTKTIVKQ